MRWIWVLGLASVALASGCGGGPSADELAADRVQLTSAITDELRQRDRAEASRAAEAREQACRSKIGSFLSALRDVDSRLDVGMSLDEYGDIVGDASVERGRADLVGLSVGCREALTEAEAALDNYSSAVDTWNDCVFDDSIYFACEFDDIDPEMQDYWLDASTAIDRAQRKVKLLARQAGAPNPYNSSLPIASYAVARSVYGAAAERLCGDNPPVAAIEACQQLSDVVQDGLEDNEAGRLNDALLGLTNALGITPPALQTDES